jgi:hypothetical protein
MNARIFSSRKRAIFFICEETFLLFLIVLQVYLLLGIRVVNKEILFFQDPTLIQNWLWLFATTLFFVTIYMGISKRDALVLKVHKELTSLIISTAKSKVFHSDRRVIALVFAEIVFTISFALSIFLYLDPEIDLFPYPTNVIVFILVMLFGYSIFSNTKEFRERTYSRGFIQSLFVKDYGPHRISRITNIKTGSIRFRRAGKKTNGFRK